MKVCPSCNVRVQEEEKDCPSCGHEFESQDQKKTMMGMPVVGEDGEIDESSMDDDSGDDSGGGLGIDRARLSKALDKARQEEAGDEGDGAEGGSSDQATRQVSASELPDSLGASGGDGDVKSTAFGIPSPDLDGDDEEEDVAGAWDLGEQPSSGTVAKTEVVDPDELDFSDDANKAGVVEGEESTSGAFGGSAVESADDDSGERDFGTLMGMSLDEQSGDQGHEGASMQFGGDGDSEPGDDGSTQALSPEELAEVEKMGIGGDDQRGEPSSDRLQPGRAQQSTPTSDNLKTAVLDESADPGSFQLRKPEDATEPKKVSTPKAGDSTPKPGNSTPSSSEAPQRPKTDPPAREQRSTSDIGESTAGAQEDVENARDRPLDTPMSGVFRAAGEKKASTSDGDRQPDRSSVSDTGVSGTGTYQLSNTSTGKEAGEELESEEENLAVGGVGSGGYTTFPTGGDDAEDEDVDSESVPQDDVELNDDDGGEGPLDVGLGEIDDEPPASGPEVGFSGADEGRTEPTFDDDIDGAAWEDEAVAPDPTGEPGGESSRDVSPEAAPENEVSSAEIKPEVDAIGDLDMAPDDDSDSELFGAGGEESGASSPTPKEPGTAPSEPGHPGPSSTPSTEPRQASSQPAGGSESDTSDTDGAGTGMQVEQLISLLQRGFGLLGAVTMLIVAIAALVIEGIPAEAVAIGAVGATVLLGALAAGCTVLPVANMKRSGGYGVIAVSSLGALGAVLVAGLSPIVAIANLAGGILLLVAAAFPLIGRAID